MATQTIHTYSQQQQQHDEPKQCHQDIEAEAALSCLPKETPVYQYQSMPQMAVTARTVDDESGYCVFVDVPERIVGDDRERVGFRKITIFPKSKTLIAKMPGLPHEAATEWFHDNLCDKVRDMGIRYSAELEGMGSAAVENRETDYTVQPKNLRRGRSAKLAIIGRRVRVHGESRGPRRQCELADSEVEA
ncbi:hypothetical protein PAAG_06198 [Paracoccidioides lutzii Pb01]|uniref:Uncharacterized protein n=1 Tax=Paracoccidioides lutzii (strain ATCC MYA-826 / Pb01) TaxID=502779 RepID=C1H688_PARBA|nr:hypothetical protein PAAG_06198 [Paracoccidioides lutzii Pb01]EEH35151.1 hypothetical protein PAAG_06198 [Paracoccidioides lutzii Pb01]